MLLATTAQTVATVIAIVLVAGWLVYVVSNLLRARREVGSEIELAPNRGPGEPDEVMEGPRLERFLGFAVVLLVIIGVGLPVYWLAEPGRQEGAIATFDEQFATWGEELFAPTAEGGFNCAGCHGAKGIGGVASYALTDPLTGEVRSVPWKAPALNTVLYKFNEDEVRYILTYGRPFSPMSAWGVAGGGPMNDQQINNLIAYLTSIQISPEEAQAALTKGAEAELANGTASSLGQALFNNLASSGTYSCARCHTNGWSYDEPKASGSGAMGPNLTGGDAARQFPDPADQAKFITDGSVNGVKYGQQGQGSGRMPGFGQLMTPEQIQAVVDYERSL